MESGYAFALILFIPRTVQTLFNMHEPITRAYSPICLHNAFKYVSNMLRIQNALQKMLDYTINKSQAIAWENCTSATTKTMMTTTFIGFIWTRVLMDFYYQLSKFYLDKWFKLHTLVLLFSFLYPSHSYSVNSINAQPFKLKMESHFQLSWRHAHWWNIKITLLGPRIFKHQIFFPNRME